MSNNNRRNHIALSSKKLKKISRRKYINKKGDNEEQFDAYASIDVLRESLNNIKLATMIKEKKINIEDESIYFIITFNGKISWGAIRKVIKDLPINIKEIIKDDVIKVSLKKHDYDHFYYKLRNYNEKIKQIRQIQIFEKIPEDLYNAILEKPDDIDSFTIEIYDISKVSNNNPILCQNWRNIQNTCDSHLLNIH